MCSRACSEPFPLIASDLHKCREQYTLISGNTIRKTNALFLAESSAPASHWFSRRHIVAHHFETFPAGSEWGRRRQKKRRQDKTRQDEGRGWREEGGEKREGRGGRRWRRHAVEEEGAEAEAEAEEVEGEEGWAGG